MIIDEYLIGSPDWLIPAAVAGVFLLGLAFRNYYKNWFGNWAGFALVLKTVAIVIFAICLLEPMGRGKRPRPQANVLPMLVDVSQSMRIKDASAGVSSADRFVTATDADSNWIQRLETTFDVRRLQFGERLDIVESFANLEFEQTRSNLRTGLQTVASRFAGRPVAGVLLFSDGNLTDGLPDVQWASLGFPIYPVLGDQGGEIPDIRLGKVAVSETDFETAPITIDTKFSHQSLPNREVTVRLLDNAKNVISQQQLKTTDEPSQPVRFRFRPETSGVSFYTIECFLDSEADLFAKNESRTEATLANNRRVVAVNQRRGPYEVLYIAGRPNWEFKYIRRALDEDAEVRMVGLLRIAKKQPKFSFRDSTIQSTANPLFAGLGGDEEEIAEQLDEPVMVPVGVKDSTELAGGFPVESETLFPFSAIIIDDLEASFFTQDQLLLLRQFVSVRGGALLILGGEDSLEKGGFGDSILAELAPVYLPRKSQTTVATEQDELGGAGISYKMELTREGLLQPFLRLRGTEEAEAKRMREAPALKVLNFAQRIKPGAVVLATATDTLGQRLPALVSHSFGRGKSAALLLGDLWRWSLQDGIPGRTSQESATKSDDDPAQVWRQIVRWLVSDVQRRVSIAISNTDLPSVVRIDVDVRDEGFAPLDGADVRISVQAPDGTTVNLVAEPDESKPGRYHTEYWAHDPGGFLAHAIVTATDNSDIGIAETGWVSEPAEQEFERLGTNVSLLTRIAEETGGKVVSYEALPQLAESISSSTAPITETWVFPLWHRWWILSLAVACLCGEWGIRRWRGLP